MKAFIEEDFKLVVAKELDRRANFKDNKVTESRQNDLIRQAKDISEELPGNHNIKIENMILLRVIQLRSSQNPHRPTKATTLIVHCNIYRLSNPLWALRYHNQLNFRWIHMFK